MTLLADALEKLAGGGRTDVFRRVSRLSKNSFRHPSDLPPGALLHHRGSLQPTPSYHHHIHPQQQQQQAPSSGVSLKKPKRKASFEGVVKQLASLAVSISTDDVKNSNASAAPKSEFPD